MKFFVTDMRVLDLQLFTIVDTITFQFDLLNSIIKLGNAFAKDVWSSNWLSLTLRVE